FCLFFFFFLLEKKKIDVERILDRSLRKLFLDALVVKKGQIINKNDSISVEQLKSMVTFGAEYVLHSSASTIKDEDIDAIIQVGTEKFESMKTSLTKTFGNNAIEFRMDGSDEFDFQTFEGTDFRDKNNQKINQLQSYLVIPRGPRLRKTVSYSDNSYFSKVLKPSTADRNVDWNAKKLEMRKWKPTPLHSFQFVDIARIHELEQKDFDANEKRRVEIAKAKQKFIVDMAIKKQQLKEKLQEEQAMLVHLRRELAKTGEDVTLTNGQSTSTEVTIDEEGEWKKVETQILDQINFLTDEEK
ncbi:hypothetical protein RFI_34284, partial [Reticulomyxa filosa]